MKIFLMYKPAATCILSFVLVFLFCANVHAQTWYNASWTYRKAITIDYTKVGAGPHTNFPVLVSITDPNLQALALSTANDILFTSADGTTKLAHEIESYTSASGALVAWVQIPTLSSTANTVIYMYYGNASAAAQQNITGTWDATFKGVYHLNNAYNDATSNAFNGVNTGVTAVTGKMAQGGGFTRANGTDYIAITGLMGSPANLTLSSWATLTTRDNNGAQIINLGDHVGLDDDDGGLGGLGFANVSGGTYNRTSSNVHYAGTGWHYLSYTYNDAGDVQYVYVDGVQVATSAFTPSINYAGLGANTYIGVNANGSTLFDFDGTLDEVRVAATVRSAGWVLTEYNNQNAPATFYSVGAQAANTKVFTGTGNFSTAANWTGGVLPVTGENLIIDGACTVDNNAATNNVAYGTLTIGTATARTLNWATGGTNVLNVSTVSNGSAISTLDMTNGGTLAIRGSIALTNLTFTPGTGTVEIRSSITIPALPTFNNLTINGSGITVALSANLSVTGILKISAGTLNSANFNIAVGGNWTNSGAFTPGTGTATFNGTTVMSGSTVTNTFNNLVLAASSTVTSSTGITGLVVNGTLNTGTSATLDLGTTTVLSGTLSTITNSGTIKTAVPTTTSATPVPAGKTWGGTIDYTNTNGGQTVVAGTYNNLTVRPNLLKTNPAGGSLIINGMLTNTTSGGIFDLGNNILSGTLTGIYNNGYVRTAVTTATSATPIPTGKNWGTTGAVEFNAPAGAQTVVSGTYWILGCTNTSGTDNAGGDLTVNSQFQTTAGGTLDMGSAYQLINGGTITSNGTVKTSVLTTTSTTPLPAGQTWGGTGLVTYAAASGAQTIVGGTYYKLTIGNSSGTNTAGGTITANNTFTTFAGGTLDMGSSYMLVTANGILNDGTVKSSVLTTTSTTPFSPGQVWNGIGGVEYAAAAGGQTVVGGIYDNLKLSNTTGTNVPGADVIVNGQLFVTAGGTLDMGSLYRLANGGTVVNNGTVKTSVLTTTSTAPLSAFVTWAGTGTVEYAAAAGAQTIRASTFNNLKLSNTSGTNTLSGNVTLNGILTFSGGTATTGTNVISLNASASLTRTAGGHVIGNLKKYAATGATSVTYEIGDATNYTPVTVLFASVTTADYLTASITATDHPNLAGSGIRTDRSVNRYFTLTNQAIVFNTATLTVNWVAGDVDAGATPANFIVGKYNNPTWTFPAVASPLATSIQATGLTSFGDFAIGEACAALSSGFSYPATPYCSNGGSITPTLTGTAGTFTSTTGLSLTASTGAVNLTLSTPGTYTVTNTVTASGGCSSVSTAGITVYAAASVTGAATESCVGGATGTITATATGGVAPYTYSLNSGAYQSAATFSGLSANTYSLNVKSASGCVASSAVVVSDYATSTDNQNATPTNSWIGHMYSGTNFNRYIGQFTETENFNELFGGSAVCFNIVSNSVTKSIYTDYFSVKFRMASTRKGLYVADLGGDDGSRLTVDGTLIYNSYGPQVFTLRPAVLMNLSGTSSLLFEYYENSGSNQAAFQNLTLVLANTLSTNTTQSICIGSTGSAISGDVYGTLPSGVTVSGTGYQWTYSTTPGGTRTAIAGATGATFTPSAAAAPFNTAGTYYVYRNAILSSANNVSPNPYVATNESNAATVQVPVSISGNMLDYTNGAHGVLCATTGQFTTASLAAPAGSVFITIGFASYGTPAGSCPTFTYGSCHAATSQAIAESYVLGYNTAGVPVSNATFGDPCYGTNKFFYIQATYTQPICSGTSPGTITGTTPTGGNGAYSYLWEMSTTSSSTGFSAASGTNNDINYTPGALTQTTWYRRTVTSGGCSDISKVLQVTVTPTPSATISYGGSPYCATAGTATVTRTGNAGGVYSSTTGLTLNTATGDITTGSSTPGTYTVSYTVAASGGCSQIVATATVTITALPVATFSYTATPYCKNAVNPSPTFTGGGVAGTFTSTAGLVFVSASTGQIDLTASTAGTYTVTNTIAASGGCAQVVATSSITITAVPVATFNYAATPYCKNAVNPSPTFTGGGAAGTFTSTTGLAFVSTSTGQIDLTASTAGTYTVTNTIAASGGCSQVVATSSITITAVPVATFSYAASPYCKNAVNPSPTFTGGGAAGTFTSTTGLAFVSASTGQIDLTASTAGTYTVTNTIAASGGCTQVVATSSVTITAVPVATFSYTASPYCKNAVNPSPTFSGGGVAGMFTSTTGLTFVNAATGQIDLTASTAGTYTVTNTIAASGGCAAVTATTSVTITAVPIATFSYTASPYCKNAVNPSPTFSGGGGAGTFTSTAGLVFVSAATGQIDLTASTAGTYAVTNTIAASGGCAAVTATTSVTITAVPIATFSYTASPYCKNAVNPSPTFSGGGVAGTFTSTTGLVFVNAATGQINLTTSTAGTYTVTNSISASGGCAAVTATSSVTITAIPIATFSYAASPYCKNAVNPLPTFTGGGVAGTFTSTTGLVFVNAATGQINLTASAAGTYTVTNTIAASGGCAAVTATTSVTITAVPIATFSYAASPYCKNAVNPLPTFTGGGVAGTFTSTTGLVFVNAATGQINLTTSTAGTYTVTNTIAASGGCTQVVATSTITITTLPVATFSYAASPYCNNAVNPLPTFTGGGVAGTFSSSTGLYFISITTGEIDLNTSTAGTYTITNTIAASGGCAAVTATSSVTITAVPVATFSYAANPYCKNAVNPSPTFTVGGVAGTFTSTAGLVFVSAVTGQIDLTASAAGTYTVTNTIAASGGCAAVTATSSVTITALPVATFSYAASPYCKNAVNPSPTFSGGGVAGTFTSTTGLTFVNAATGQIDLTASTAGTYTVTNTIAASGGCAAVTATSSVTITAVPIATFSYTASPYCKNAVNPSPTFSGGGVAGTFTSTAGLVFVSAATGQIDLTASTAGTYAVTNTIAASGGCAQVVATSSVTITPVPTATITYTGSPYCSNASPAMVTFSGTTGGIYSSTTGLSINAATGAVLLSASTAGTYVVTYTVAASGGCTAFATTANITVLAAPAISQVPVTNLKGKYYFEGNANDATGNNNGTLQNSPALTADRFNVAGKAYNFNGSTQYISTTTLYTNPGNFTISIWFKTTSVTGGKLIGFGNLQTGTSTSDDRHIYMSNTGQIYFGLFPGAVRTVNSALSYNDGQWHLATASLSGTAGMFLYVDGTQAGSNATVVAGENYAGYWRIGYDNVNGWPGQPSGFYFNGSLDDALIYDRALTAAEVAALYNSPEGAGNNGPVCVGSALNLTATTVSSASYAWTGPNGFTSTLQNPTLIYGIANAGVYTLQVTSGGCTATAYTSILSSTNAGQWTGNISTDWANTGNWCSGVVPTSSTNVTITAGATRMPSIVSTVSCNNLTINTGASVSITGTGTLNIAGMLTNNGTYTDNGTTVFNGAAGQQTFSGVNTFNNLTLNNTGGLLIPAAVVINSNLTLTAGVLNANNLGVSVGGNWINNASATAFAAGSGTVTFNGAAPQAVTGNFATNFYNLTIADPGSVVSLQVNANVAGNLVVSAGTFDLGAFTANRTTAGGSLTVANNATLKIGGTGGFPVNYTSTSLPPASTVEYAGADQSVANYVYGNLMLSSAAGAVTKTLPATALMVVGNLTSTVGAGTAVSYAAAAAITIGGNVSIGAGTTFSGGSYTHAINGSWMNNGTYTGNTSTVVFNAPGTVVSGTGAQNFNNLTVAASGVTFSSAGMALSGNLATTGSGSFTQAANGTLSMSGSGTVISGAGISLNNLTVSGTVTTANALAVTGNLAVSGSFAATGGPITMSGAAKTISGAGAISFAVFDPAGSITATTGFSITSALVVDGSFTASAGTATFTGASSLSGTANLNNVAVNGTSLQLSAGSVLGIAGALTLVSGTLDVTSSSPNTVNFNGTGAQNINSITYSNLVLSNGNTKTAVGAIITNASLTIQAGTTFDPSSYTHTVYSDWTNNGTFITGTGTVQFLGAQTSNITGATTFNILTENKDIVLKSNVSAATVNMASGTMLTGTNTLTITGTRTGSAIIIGNIRRTHAFTTGVAYAFEGLNNTITFSSVSSVTSVTVSVVKGSISDFPFGGSISRRYTITVPAGTYTADLRLHYEDVELNANNESSIALWQYSGSAWGAIGKTANDTVANYVEQTGLTNITNRWTLSDNSNVVQWNGSVSTDWNTAANWTVLQGSASTPPSANDIANLGNGSFINQPTISTAVNVKSVNFGSAQAVTLTMAAGGTLTAGSIKGTWSANATHTINVNNQSITTNGGLVLSDGVSGNAINLNIGAGSVNVIGSLNQSGGANIVFTGAGNLSIANNFNSSNGTFTAGTGTVTYNGSTNQTVAAVNYYHLTINKSGGLAAINNTSNIAGNLLVSAGELDNFSETHVAGNVTLNTGGILNNYQNLYVQGNWNNNGTYTPTGSSIYFNGSGQQNISASTFNNLNINKPSGTATLMGNVVITGDFIVSSGTFDFQTYTCNRNLPGGTAILADGATSMIGANNPPQNFSNNIIGPASTTIFYGTTAQFIGLPGVTFGNLIFRDAGLKTVLVNMTVKGDLTIDTLAALNATSSTVTLLGNWVNHGTFIPSTSTVLLNGLSKTITGVTTFNKVTVAGNYILLNNITFNNLLTVTSTGIFSAGAPIVTTLNGDFTNNGVLYSLGTTTFTGNVLQTLSLINSVQTVALTVNFNGTVSPVLNSTSTPLFGYLNINNTGGVNPSVGWTINYALNVSSGASFNGGTSSHYLYGALTNNGTITSSGTLIFIPATAATVNLGSNFSSTGGVYFAGAGAITLAGTPVSFNNININNSNSAGITPSSNWNMTKDLTVASGSVMNAGNYTYSIGGNILNSGTINSGTSTFTLNGSSQQDIRSASAFNNLTINKPAGPAVLLTNVTVNGVLDFVSGKIQTGTNRLIQPLSGTLTGAAQQTGWVNGNLQKYISTGASGNTFAIGDAFSYTPAAIAFDNVTAAGNVTASTIATEHPNISSSPINADRSVNRYWTFINSGVQFSTYSATLNFVSTDVDAGANTAAFAADLYNSTSWLLPVTALSNPTSIQATGVTAFGDFAVGEVCNRGTAISYSNPSYCKNAGIAPVTRAGTAGGTYTSTAGLAINNATGDVTPSASAAGTYIVTYTIAASGSCRVYITTASITILESPVAVIAYTASPYCSNADTAAVSQTGTAGGVYSSTTGLTINPSTGTITVSSSTPGTYTVTYTITATGGCAAYQTTAAVSIVLPGTWSGSVSTAWNVSGNWLCGAIPSTTTDVTIPGSLVRYPVLSTGTGSVHNLTIQSGASLTVTSATLQISGSISNSGTLDAVNGTVALNGSAAQTIAANILYGNAVQSLTINNPAGVTLGGPLSLTDVLTITTGNLFTGGYLTLRSTATATARVAPITSLAATPVNGQVTVERYIPGQRKYRLIASSVTTSAAASLSAGQESLSIWGNWQNGGNNVSANVGTIITGGGNADGFDNQTTNASLFTYDDVNRRYVGYTSANGKNTKYTPLKAGVAYYMFVYGDRINTVYTSSPNNTVISTKGTLLTGSQVYTPASSIALSGVTGRFSLLGNPFASPIDWATIPKTNLDNTYWGWDPNLSSTGGYITVTTLGTVTLQAPFSGSTGLNQYIQPGQGFFVRTAGTSPVLTIREQDKVSNFNGNAFRIGNRTAGDLSLLAVNLLYGNNGGGKILSDGVLAVFDASFSDKPAGEDAVKMANSAESMAILHDSASLSIDARKMPHDNDTLFLTLSRLTRPQYTLQVFAQQIESRGLLAYLEDTYMHTVQPLLLSDTNNIVFTVNAGIPASSDINRFRIVFHSSVISLPVTYTLIKATPKNKDILINWDVANESGILKYEIERSADGTSFNKVGEISATNRNEHYSWLDISPLTGNNAYRVVAVAADGKIMLSRVVAVNMRATRWVVKVYPNPVRDQRISLHSEEMEKGLYTVVVLNAQGQQVIYRVIDHQGGAWNQVIYFSSAQPAGTYYLQIGNEKQQYRQSIFVE